MKIVEVVAASGHMDTVRSIAESNEALDVWDTLPAEDGRQCMRMLLEPASVQPVLDALQSVVTADAGARVVVLPVDTSLPLPKEAEQEAAADKARTSREALYDEVAGNARLSSQYFVLVILSTIVAAIGLLEDNVAVVIGAMVIAPLLGPNLALALGAALGDTKLIGRALASAAAGLGLALILSWGLGLMLPVNTGSHELASRMDVGLDSVGLALASGAAAVLSLTSGLSTTLVGVMVAVALLPPTATLGLALAGGNYVGATGAALLLATNIVCVNLSAKVVFLLTGMGPRTWREKQKARRTILVYLLIWSVALMVLLAVIARRN